MTHENPSAAHPQVPVAPSAATLTPLGLDEVTITGGFWADRQEVNAERTLRHCLEWITRLGWLENFARTARGDGGHVGRQFADSEIYKLLEALAWESARTADEWAERTFQEVSAQVVAAQQPDGYLNTQFGGPGQERRYSDLEWGHELYCAGHLIQAAVARLRTSGPDAFTAAAIRVADHVEREFGPDGRDGVDGHPEIEVALAELGRATGDRRHLEQARLFVERRGQGDGALREQEIGRAYFQDDVPVREADTLRGHAVRALYLSAGAADVADEFGDAELGRALRQQWRNTVARRTYLTGGMGSRHEGEAFGDDFELPSDRAYSETCAGVASVMFSWRLLLADGEERYADLIERTLFNVIATSPDEQGTAFFYVNPLQRTVPGTPGNEDTVSPRAASSLRSPWFDVSCCPPNVARTLASLAAYVATRDEDGVQLHQFAPATIRTAIGAGSVAVTVETAYPHDGTVRVTIDETPREAWTLSLRIPAWAAGATAAVNGEPVAAPAGRLDMHRRFERGDVVELVLPMAPRWTHPDHRIDDLRETVAVERGPIVLCAESVDLPEGVDLLDLEVDPGTPPAPTGDGAVVSLRTRAAADGDWPYAPEREAEAPSDGTMVRLVPYHRWAERGPSTMRIWLPERTPAAEPAQR
jgi:DUF1680 family protein